MSPVMTMKKVTGLTAAVDPVGEQSCAACMICQVGKRMDVMVGQHK
jgi:hypothetical protein